MTATGHQPDRRQILADKVLLLTTLFGPVAGCLTFMGLAALGRAIDGSEIHTHDESVVVGPLILFVGYLLGLLPALLSGFLLRAYIQRKGQRLWLAGALVGTSTPALCLFPLAIPVALRDGWQAMPVVFVGGGAAALGLGAALITEALGYWLLKNDIEALKRS